jgi:hypothetical protein
MFESIARIKLEPLKQSVRVPISIPSTIDQFLKWPKTLIQSSKLKLYLKFESSKRFQLIQQLLRSII